MKKYAMLLGFLASLFSGKAQKSEYDKYPVYSGTDLGLTYSPAESRFRIWAPTAEQARLLIYSDHENPNFIDVFPMKKDLQGTWVFHWKGNHKGALYAFSIYQKGQWLEIVPDPYAKAVAVNGKRAAITDLRDTDPADWSKDKSPAFRDKNSAIIYELHVRDASIQDNSGIREQGKFLGLTETGTHNHEGYSTGLDHLKVLGITHVHLLPVYDFNSLDHQSL